MAELFRLVNYCSIYPFPSIFLKNPSLRVQDLKTGVLLEHMPGRQRNALVGVDFLSAGSWVKCVKMVQGPTPQAGSGESEKV